MVQGKPEALRKTAYAAPLYRAEYHSVDLGIGLFCPAHHYPSRVSNKDSLRQYVLTYDNQDKETEDS